MKTLMDWLNPAAVTLGLTADTEASIHKSMGSALREAGYPTSPKSSDPPGRPDMADVIDMQNLSIEEISDSVLEAEVKGGLPRMEYPLPLEPR